MTHDTREVEEIKKWVLEILGYEYEEGLPLGDYANSLNELDTVLNNLQTSTHHQLQKAREEEREQVLWNVGGMIEKENFGQKVTERTGDAVATWEVQATVRAIQTIIDRYQSELDQPTRDDWNEDMEHSHGLNELDQDKK